MKLMLKSWIGGALQGKIPGMVSLTVAVNENHNDKNPADLMLESIHDSWESLSGYQSHPLHQEVGLFISQTRDERLCVDYVLPCKPGLLVH